MIFDWIHDHRAWLSEQLPLVEALRDAIDHKSDLSLEQWLAWLGAIRALQPDCILDLGTGRGNSATLHSLAAMDRPDLRIHTFDLKPSWPELAMPRLTGFPQLPVDRVQQHVGDMTKLDFAPLIGDAASVLVIFDAHGFEMADLVLAHIMPLIAERRHLVLCHDISDGRFLGEGHRPYGNMPIWTGVQNTPSAYTWVDWMVTLVDQAIPLADFCRRNETPLHSADWDWQSALKAKPEQAASIAECLPLGSGNAFHFAYYSMNETASRHFPARRWPPSATQVMT